MKRTKIAITGVGGGVGQSIIKALQTSTYDLVKIDGDIHGAGLFTKGISYLGKYASEEEEFMKKIIQICKKEKCELLFPGLDIELPIFAKNKARLQAEAGTTVIVSDPSVIEIADDKLLTAEFLKKNNFTYPQTIIAVDYKNFRYPAVLKVKKGGARAQNLFIVDSLNECEKAIKLNNLDINNYVLQEYLEGDEYTCGTVCFDQVYGVIPMRRILRDGDTYKAFSVKNKEIQTYISKVASKLKPYGACNFQLRVKDNKIVIFEINARCSGTTGARMLAGFNEPLAVCEFLLNNKVPNLNFKEITILRYWKELVVENRKVEEIKNFGVVKNDKTLL